MTNNNELCKLLSKCKEGDQEAIETFIKKFMPLADKHSKQLIAENLDDDSTPLMEAILDAIYKIPKDKPEGCIKKYIRKSVENKHYAIAKYNKEIRSNEAEWVSESILEIKEDKDTIQLCVDGIFLNELLDKLTNTQKAVILQVFFNGVSVTKLAKDLNRSRQSINQTKNDALKNLRKFAFEN